MKMIPVMKVVTISEVCIQSEHTLNPSSNKNSNCNYHNDNGHCWDEVGVVVAVNILIMGSIEIEG